MCRSVLPCLSIQAAMRNFYIWCQNHSQALHREKSTKTPHKSGSVHSGVDRGVFLTFVLQGNLARNLFPTITLNHIITLCHHASFLTLRNEKNMDEGLTIYIYSFIVSLLGTYSEWALGFGTNAGKIIFFSKNTYEEEFENTCKWQQSRYIYVLYIKHHSTQSLLVTWLSCSKKREILTFNKSKSLEDSSHLLSFIYICTVSKEKNIWSEKNQET